ncbi:J domain-containing protein [Halobaculum marinum]|uniref:J domain-containing protein n=1 Tax=Halobaculum marinum TaxID=3031996 RepID=A0ABD5WYB1_9EURY|nr:J domain-containing protein [Halobaculum sp. DT55]
MDRDVLLLGIAAVLAGLTATLVMLGITQSLFVLVAAIPTGAAAYFMWYQASGRMKEDLRARAARERASAGERRTPGGDSRFAREARERARARMGDGGRVGADGGRRATSGRTRGRGTTGGATVGTDAGMPRGDARRTLGVDPGASQSEVKSAYRDRVKETHPDSGGDEDEFKRVNRAYETLKER